MNPFRAFLTVTLMASLACRQDAARSSGTAVMDASFDAVPDQAAPERGAPDAVEAGGIEASAAGAGTNTCADRLVGDSPFGAVLAGEADFVARGLPSRPPRHARIEVHAYFPHGRRAGEPLVLAMAGRFPRPALIWTGAFVLDGAGGIPATDGVYVADDLMAGFEGALIGPDQGLVGRGFKNFAFNTDVGDMADASITLCRAGAAAAPRLIGDEAVLVPNLPLWFAPGAPVDEATLPQLRVLAAGRPVPVNVALARQDLPGGRGVVVTPLAAFPPSTPITFETGGLLDVIGRPFVVEQAPAPLITTATVTDLTFFTTPPPGAIANQPSSSGPPAAVADGLLMIGGQDARVLIALGDPGARSMVRVRAGVDCGLTGPTARLRSTAAVVAGQGEATVVDLACGPLQDITVSRPAAGPLWLSIVISLQRGHPQNLPLLEGNTIKIDEIVFE